MKKLTEYICDGLKIGSNTIISKKIPKTKEELKLEILKKIIDKEVNYNDIDISHIDDLSHLFEDYDITEIDISKWNVSNVKSTVSMFYNCKYLKTVGDLSKWDVSNIEDMSFMFANCQCLQNIGDLSNWEINGTELYCTFSDCKRLKTIGQIQHWRPATSNFNIFQLSAIHPQPTNRVK